MGLEEKFMKYPRAWAYAFLALFLNAAAVNAAGVPIWVPTSSSLTTFEIDFGEFVGLGRDFAIFGDNDLVAFANPLGLNTSIPYLTTIDTLDNGNGTWTFTNTTSADTLDLDDPGAFAFGFTADNGATWSAEAASWTELSADFWSIEYAFDPGVVRTAYLAVNNVSLAPVPVPAAVWLFGTGLLGLVGIARRKKAA